MSKITDNFLQFVDNTPNAYLCVDNLRKELIGKGFVELNEGEKWDDLDSDGKYFVVRNDSSLIAFKMVDKNDNVGFNITSSHSDSPSFSIKPNPDMYTNDYLKLNVGSYGGMINYSWLDRPLSIAGRVISYDKGIYQTHVVDFDKDLLIIPSQAIHINRDVNSKNELNHQVDMLPVMALNDNKNLDQLIMERLNSNNCFPEKICDYDLYLYNRDKAKKVGVDDEFILAPRLDDLACLYPALCSFIDSDNNNSINVFCAFNNEEIGSLTQQGADSSFLLDVLSRICQVGDIDLLAALSNSFVVSADNAHATHPNASAKNDPTNKVYLNSGVVIKHHTQYTTDALSSALFKGVCDCAGVPYQDFACRSDMRCGSTLGGISQSHVSVDSVDIGIPQLAMHSANEMIGVDDLSYMYDSLAEFYQTTFVKERPKGLVKVIKNYNDK